MPRGIRLLSAAFLLLLCTLAVSAYTPARGTRHQAPSQAPSQAPGTRHEAPISGEYLGSQSCARCHEVEHTQWTNSLHIKMTKPVADATIVGDFRDGTTFADHDRSYRFGTRNGKPFVTVSFGGGAAETFQVDYTLGAKRYQGYLSTLPEGRIYVLPVFWHLDSQRWVDWQEITPIPDGAHDIRQIWNTNCFNCHATNIVRGFDAKTRTYRSTWTEMGIGCEACHGPGREHVALMGAWEKDPASKPKYDSSSKNRQLSDTLKIFSTRSSDPRRVYDTCAYCHGNKTHVFTGFKGGDAYADYALPFLMSEPIPENDPQGEFWPDGRPNRFNRPQALTLSGCFQAGAVTCTSCHVAHGSRHEFSLKVNINQGRNGDALCTQCHTEPKAGSPEPAAGLVRPSGPQALKPSFSGSGLEAHTFHAADSAGSRCINCHMSDANWRLLIRRRDHTFQPPVPENTAQFGIPNACTTCHDNRSPEWPARLAVDRSEGLFLRASAADSIARLITESRSGVRQRGGGLQAQTSFDRRSGGAYGASNPRPNDRQNPRENDRENLRGTPVEITPAIINAMIGAADDPEPVVRAAAVKTLGIIGDRDRALGPVLARLVDPARVVRARAAEVLESFGVIELPGRAGEVLRLAQDEHVQGLLSFMDVASHQASRGWFEAQRGRVSEAHAALDAAVALEPNFAYPFVVKGVLFAREGRFADALEMWKKARTIEPSYPNIDQLIAEAEKRK
jgi:predicted CXXCH cytochrome family protein